MNARPQQLAFGLPHVAQMGRADFIVGDANRQAAALIDRWPDWPERGVLLAGPVGSGKSHLANAWRNASGADLIVAAELTAGQAALVGERGAAVEDLHVGPVDEAALFHLINAARERRAPLLLTSRVWPAGLSFRLPDLASRLRAMQPVELQAPDDALLRRVVTKLFADRQVAVEPPVVDFIVVRMERSLAAANTLVERLDREALAAGRPVTTRLAGLVIAELFDRQPDLWPE